MASEIKAKFEGTWTYVKSENLEAYLEKLGIGLIKKTAAMKLSPTLVIKVEGETITVTLSALLKSNKTSYKLDEEYSVEGEGFTGKAITAFADGKMTTSVTPNDTSIRKTTVVREIVGEQLVQTMTVDEVVAKRFFCKK